jgi:hypothetical protein
MKGSSVPVESLLLLLARQAPAPEIGNVDHQHTSGLQNSLNDEL